MAGLLVLAAAVAAGFLVLRHVTSRLDYDSLIRALRHFNRATLAWSLAATGVSFAALIGRDLCALRHIGQRVPFATVVVASVSGNALGNAVGLGTLTGGAIRYRIYGAAGLKPDAVARIMVFIAVGFGIGLAGCGGVALLAAAPEIAPSFHLPVLALRLAAIGLLAATASLVLFQRRVRVFRFEIALPGPALGSVQLLLTGLDLAAAAAALYVLLPAGGLDFGGFTAVFIAATALGVISHAPGGLGVFEAVVFLSLGHRVPSELSAAALIVYRGIYFGVPLLVSAGLLAAFELRGVAGAGGRLARAAAPLSPVFLGVITFVVGSLLIVSGATPAFGHRLALLSVKVPLVLVEASHFLGSLAGVLLLFVARGLMNRLDGAWWLALVLTIGSLVLSLAKGLAYVEASLVAVLLLLLLATRRRFDRRASMLDQVFTGGWFLAVGLILAASTWILLFAFRDVAYTRDLWWQFEFDATAPRALRAMLGMCVLALALGLWTLLQVPRGKAERPGPAELARAARIIAAQDRGEAMLALMGDKSLMFSASGLSFLMFAKRGRSWIALYDPVGPRDDWPELVWRFVEMASSHGGRAAFYQVRADALPLYLDAGLKIMKLGEEARVKLADFSLQGSSRSHLRYALKRGERDGLSFEFLAPGEAGAVVGALQAVSDEWLASRHATEKSFSVAAFEPGYVAAQWVALVRHGERIVAFATVMATDRCHEAAIGLMRQTDDAGAYAMEFLFTRLIQRLRADGHASLSLGMAPLSGLEPRPLASRWHRIGNLIWRHGGILYNFQGLRLFKGKFGPVWESRYLAASGTVGPFVALVDTAALASAGPRP
jgi:phosphatidylglycerol lysyltransferase